VNKLGWKDALAVPLQFQTNTLTSCDVARGTPGGSLGGHSVHCVDIIDDTIQLLQRTVVNVKLSCYLSSREYKQVRVVRPTTKPNVSYIRGD